MVTAALIIGALTFVVTLGITLIVPACTLCVVPFLGLGAGYVAATLEKPPTRQLAISRGVGAGTIGGTGALLGQVAGSIVNALVMGPAGYAETARRLGLTVVSESGYWAGLVTSTACLGGTNLILMVMLGTLGGLIWWRVSGMRVAGDHAAYASWDGTREVLQ